MFGKLRLQTCQPLLVGTRTVGQQFAARAQRRIVSIAVLRVARIECEDQPVEKASPVALSTGEQQRVGIARAIVAKPQLIIADEPTGNLDTQLSLEIMNLFAEFSAVGTTVLIASHDLLLLKRMRRRVLVLDHGRLVDDYRPEAAA